MAITSLEIGDASQCIGEMNKKTCLNKINKISTTKEKLVHHLITTELENDKLSW